MEQQPMDIEITIHFKDERYEFFIAGGDNNSYDAQKDAVIDIIKKGKLNIEEIEGIYITDRNDYDEEKECYVTYEMWIFKEDIT